MVSVLVRINNWLTYYTLGNLLITEESIVVDMDVIVRRSALC